MRKRLRTALLWLATACLAAAAPLVAQDKLSVQRQEPAKKGAAWVQESTCNATAREGGRLVLRADLGSVIITPGANNKVECRVRLEVMTSDAEQARRLANAFEVGFRTGEAGTLLLNGRFTRPLQEKHTSLGISYDIRVPARFNLDLETRGGSVSVERLEGELRAVTAAGSIRTGDITGPVRVETAGGSIALGNIGQRAEARTAGGNIKVGDVQGDAVLETSGGKIVTGRITGQVRAGTAGGDIVVAGAGGDLVAETAGGKIRIGEAGGQVRAETAGGSIYLETARGPVRAETAGGSIALQRVSSGVQAVTVAGRIYATIVATSTSFQPSRLETSFGDIEVYLPADLPLTIDAEIHQAMDHTISTDFPLQVKPDPSGYGPRTIEARGDVNGGGGLLRIRTTMGNITIRKLTAASTTPPEGRKQ